MKGALNYNEQKVQQGNARCIMAHQFMKAVHELTFYDKLERFTTLMARNRRTKTNTLHISLNFDPSEKLNVSRLQAISLSYMEKIGFGQQPCLVYQHHDAAHPHVHIITTNIRPGGDRISLHNLGRTASEKARQEIEKDFSLVPAAGKKQQTGISPKDVEQRASYGQTATKDYISKVVRFVSRNYRYTSLPELNAALGYYHVAASRGSKGSTMYRQRGLQYTMLEARGAPAGVPIKASAVAGKPTLAYLEKQYARNRGLRTAYRLPVRHKIELALQKRGVDSLNRLSDHLAREGITILSRTSEKGRIFGITFVDHHHQVVFNGSSLGKAYGARGIMERLNQKVQPAQETSMTHPPADPQAPARRVQPHAWEDLCKGVREFQMPLESLLGLNKKRKKKRKRKRR